MLHSTEDSFQYSVIAYTEKELEKNKLFLPEELNSKNPNQICVSQKQKYEDSNKI